MILWMLSSSAKEPLEIFKQPPTWIPIKKFVRIDDQKYAIDIVNINAEVSYKNELNIVQNKIIDFGKIKIVHTGGWVWPWNLRKWQYAIREKSKDNRFETVPVQLKKRVVLKALIPTG